jgi:hypothetical protein
MDEIENAIKEYINAIQNLNRLGVLKNKKDFTGQLGEWLVETLFDGKRSDNGIQKGWDVEVNGKRIQVKTHSKAESNDARFTRISCYEKEGIDELIIIVFTFDYKIKHFFIVPWEIAYPLTELRTQKQIPELKWSLLKDFDEPLDKLPKQDIISMFR